MTSHSEWGEKTSGLEVAKVYTQRIRGRNVLITGVSPEGVGEGTAVAFASQKPKILILASRTKEKLDKVAKSIRNLYPGVDIRTVTIDLASQASIRRAATEVDGMITKLDILVNNAGATYNSRRWTVERIEIQFGANHIGPFLFTKLLFPLLEAATKQSPAGATRVVNLSSHGHRLSTIRFHDYNIENKEVPPEEKPFSPLPPTFARVQDDGYMPTIAYAQSKTANILFTLYLQDHLQKKGITSYAVHPGGVSSNLGREHDEEMADAIAKTSKFWKNVDQGASTTLVAALDPALDVPTDIYLADCQFFPSADYTTDPAIAERLWRLSEELIGEKFNLE
ncbi:retinol dehydrogenase 13 [Annulohypoxylon maeteangense]|uniref:retinol dehydrogenase 13 n=1 Tax=Annulohypoxylon maeteangense TaxID=1927788 RepID=UPI002008B3B3|nr:retinol dehydrogenase 13 [Annulohypoxylon maeteangense]KAI0880531.1 retinol dehydrogenase 13 [Annulohypoxylon maeteangense]